MSLFTGVTVLTQCPHGVYASDLDQYFHQSGPFKGTLIDDRPLPLFDKDPQNLWNQLFAAFYIRPRHLPSTKTEPSRIRYEGGDVIEFLAWGRTEYWSSRHVFEKVDPLLDQFLVDESWKRQTDSVKKVVFQHDLWAVYDHLVDQNMKRTGDLETRQRRDRLCSKLARCIASLAVSASQIESLPDTYAAAIQSGAFVPDHRGDASRNYLPYGLLDQPEEWVEVDFHQPDIHEDISDRFITLHSQSLQGRSYYRIFYRFPEGRLQLESYLKELEEKGIDWKKAANNGFIATRRDAPLIPIGTEVVLLQLMMTLNDQLKPVPTKVVESFQFRVFRNLDGSSEPPTNTGVGVNILDYRMKRRLLFDHCRHGGLEREPEEMPQYRVAIDGLKATAPDWGFADKTVLFQQCVDCHMSRKLERLGVASIPSIVHSGGFDAGAQMGVVRLLAPSESTITGQRVAKFKSRHETYRRLLDHLGL